MNPHQFLIEFLKEVHAQLGTLGLWRPSLTHDRVGNPEIGYEDRLALVIVSVGPEPEGGHRSIPTPKFYTYFIEDTDFLKTPEQLALEIRSLHLQDLTESRL